MPASGYLGGFYLGDEYDVFGAEAPIEEAPTPAPPPAEEEHVGGTVMAREAYAELGPIAAPDPRFGFPVWALVNAIAEMFRQGEEAGRALDGHAPFSQVLDLSRTPAWLLPFVGLAVGVSVRNGTPAEQRAQIEQEEGWKRGRPTAIIAAVRSTLTGEKRVHLVERQGGDAWRYLVVTRPGETPSPALTELAGNAAKPVGIIATYVQSEVRLIDELTGTIDALTGTIDSL